MLTLEKFERLCVAPIATKTVALQTIGSSGELTSAWLSRLPYLDKHEQYRQVKNVLSELVSADINDETRLNILEATIGAIERLIVQFHQEYIGNPQSPLCEQRTCVEEVRSMLFLLILCYQGIAFRSHQILNSETVAPSTTAKKASWLDKLKGNLGAVVKNGVSADATSGTKRLYILSVYRIMNCGHKLLLEFALTYEKSPSSLWRVMNGWFLKSAMLGVDKQCVSKLNSELSECCIYQQYIQSCVASFTNLFAYRRPDILNIFKLVPVWAKYVKTTFTPDSHLKAFVNLQAGTALEMITPYASINPYSNEHVCLFFDGTELFAYLAKLETSAEGDNHNVFESRLAKMVLMAFYRQTKQSQEGRTRNQAAEILVGFGSIFKEIAEGRSFNQVIVQSKLPEAYCPQRTFDQNASTQTELVKLLRKNDSSVQFVLTVNDDSDSDEQEVITHPLLPLFGLFAMKSQKSTNKHPWRLGIVHWAATKEGNIEVDGRFLGRLLSVCGVRLNGRDMRSKDFMQALLVAGDALNQQTTLVIPRYHFKEGDLVILRIDQKETSLRLEKLLLSTDDIEQYQIVRLS